MNNLKYSEILLQNRSMFKEIKGTPYRVKILTNVTISSIKELLEYDLHINQINPFVEIGNYDNIIQDSTNCIEFDLVIIFYNTHNIIDGISSFFEDIEHEMYQNIKEKICSEIDIIFDNLKNSPSVIFNTFSSKDFVSSYSQKSKIELLISELNEYLEKKKSINVDLIEIDKIIMQLGIDQSIDFKLYSSSKAPYTLAFFKNYIAAIETIVFRNTGKLKKAIIFDCDNTLWKGVLGEDGIDNIDMSGTSHQGRFYNKIQQIAIFLSKRGVIVGLCSKNNEIDVSEVLMNHPDIILNEKYITIKKVNWLDKVENLKSIASELNIGLDSIVFVDDSSFEINLIKEQLPEIITCQVPSAIYEYPNKLLKVVYKYFNLSDNGDDSRKTELYKQQFIREIDRNKYENIEEYLSSLNISLTIYKDEHQLIPRIAQLTQKTNQFNLTTRRYTENQILNFMNAKDIHVFAVSVKDKFGDSGLTAVSIIRENMQKTEEAIIDTFLMSCRIIGRNIEFKIIDYIINWLENNRFQSISTEFIPTKKNGQVEHFYDNLGFNLISNKDELNQYSIKLSDYVKKNIEYISIETDVNHPNFKI